MRARGFGALGGLAALAAACVLAGTMASVGTAAGQDKPAEKAPPASVQVEAVVILASKGEKEQVDEGLKGIADLLKNKFKDQFNVFRHGGNPSGKVELNKTISLSLLAAQKLSLKVSYEGVKGEDMVSLRLSIVKTEVVDEKPVERNVLGPLGVALTRGQYLLLGGPQVGKETLIVAVRVAK